MTIVVLMLLAVIWVAVLAPPLLRRGAESRRSDSVGDFRRHLGVLQKTGPGLIAPAHTRRAAGASPAGRSRPAAPYGGARVATTGSRPALRSQTLRRRRNVLVGLAGLSLFLLVLGALPGLHVVLAAAVVSLVLLGGYVAMLVHMRNLAAERDMKLTFLPQASPRTAGFAPADAGLLFRRSATN